MIKFLLLLASLLITSCAKENKPVDWLVIDWGYAGNINKPTVFSKNSIATAFPGAIVKQELITTSYGANQGYNIYLTDSQEPVFSVTPDPDTDKIFAVLTRSSLVSGPEGMRVGVSNYQQVKNLGWACDWGFGALKQTMICINGKDRIRGLFVAPQNYQGEFKLASAEDIDKAILSELMFWPGRK